MPVDAVESFGRAVEALRAVLSDPAALGGPDGEAALAALRAGADELSRRAAGAEAAAREARALVDCTPDGLLLTDAVGVVREANPAAARLLAAGEGGAAGRLLGEFVAPEDQAAFCDELDRAVRGEPARERVLRLRSGGAGVWAAAPARDGTGRDLGVVWQLRAAPVAAATAVSLQDTWHDPGPRSPARVLVVDDEELVRSLTCNVLRAEGYEVVEARDGRAAVDAFRKARGGFDLVLLDWVMPLLSGGETLAELRRLDPGVAVIVVSGFMQGQSDAPSGVLSLVEKPYSLKNLVEKVKGALAGRRAGA